jgi:hypothetical protein
MKKYQLHIVYAFATVLALLMSACSDDNIDTNSAGGGMVHVRASIDSRGQAGTRSTYVDADGDNELITSWWIAVVNSSTKKVERIITREDYKTYAVEREAFEFEIAAGTYDVYSFANISKADVEALSGVGSITEGGNMPDMSGVTYNISSLIPNGTADKTIPIPMTGKKTVAFTSSGIQSEEFEVIRMVGKLEFTYRNAGSKKITLKYLKMFPLNVGDVLLMPDYSTLTLNGEKDPVLLSGVTVSAAQVTYPADAVLDASTYGTKSYSHSFYLRESLAASHPTGHFIVNLGIERDGKADEILYTLSGDNFSGINRNDYVNIPIKFTDYIVDIFANFYPPIGGFPAIVTNNKKDEFYVTFATQGDFEITPKVYDTSTTPSTEITYPQFNYSIESITGSTSIFSVQPSLDATTGEITGKLNTSEGTACVNITVNVEVSAGLWQTYKRRIYIIRKN